MLCDDDPAPCPHHMSYFTATTVASYATLVSRINVRMYSSIEATHPRPTSLSHRGPSREGTIYTTIKGSKSEPLGLDDQAIKHARSTSTNGLNGRSAPALFFYP